jgi:hypothetical protein
MTTDSIKEKRSLRGFPDNKKIKVREKQSLIQLNGHEISIYHIETPQFYLSRRYL